MNYFRKLRIQRLYRKRFSRDELLIMYRDWFHVYEPRARQELTTILRHVGRDERI